LQQIEKLLEGRKVIRYTEAEKSLNAPDHSLTSHLSPLTSSEVLLINCFGLLSSIYRYADVAYVGGGFGVGIHNLPEAAVWSVPVFFGPNNARFQEAQQLKQNGGGIEITSYEDFQSRMNDFIAHPETMKNRGQQAGQYVMGRSGATDKILRSVGL